MDNCIGNDIEIC